MSEHARLVHTGKLDPGAADHFPCHYSSERFAPVVEALVQKAGLAIPRQRWYRNLSRRGNTGIFKRTATCPYSFRFDPVGETLPR